MKAHLQITVGIILIGIFTLIPSSIFAHGKGKKKGHHKYEHHQRQSGPPAWAPAHRHSARQLVTAAPIYAYNPEYNIYFDRQREVYFFIHRGRWTMSAQLPMALNNRKVRNGFHVLLSYSNNCDSGDQLTSTDINWNMERRRIYSRTR